MKKNLYFRHVFRRKNHFKTFIYDLFDALASYPRLMLEVFIRRNFGERYFSASSVLTVFIILFALPLLLRRFFEPKMGSFSDYSEYQGYLKSRDDLIQPGFEMWYLFMGAFIVFSIIRAREIARQPSVFNFGRFSLCAGVIHPLFFKIRVGGKPATYRAIETLWEPLGFLIIGIILNLIGQHLGVLLIVSAVFYSISYMSAYHNGDNFIMDKIDEMIMNEELENGFVNEDEGANSRGVRFYANRPTSKEMRENLAASFIEEETVLAT